MFPPIVLEGCAWAMVVAFIGMCVLFWLTQEEPMPKIKINGRKTYFAAAGLAALSLGLYYTGAIEGARATELILEAAGLAGLRHAIERLDINLPQLLKLLRERAK